MKLKLDAANGHANFTLEKLESGSVSLKCNGWYLFTFNTDGTTLGHCCIGSGAGLELTKGSGRIRVRK